MISPSDRSPSHPAPAGLDPLRVVALIGSSRLGSYNRALLDAACLMAPRDLAIEVAEIGDLPFFDADLEATGDPAPVRRLKGAIARADAVLVVTPEYNRSIPAVLKNALDWASRPSRMSPLAGKPALVIGASSGRSAAKHAIQHVSDVLAHIGALPHERSLGVPRAGDLIGADGRMGDARTIEELRELLVDFERTVRSLERLTAAA